MVMTLEEKYKIVCEALKLACNDLEKSNLSSNAIYASKYLIKAEENLGFGLSFEEI